MTSAIKTIKIEYRVKALFSSEHGAKKVVESNAQSFSYDTPFENRQDAFDEFRSFIINNHNHPTLTYNGKQALIASVTFHLETPVTLYLYHYERSFADNLKAASDEYDLYYELGILTGKVRQLDSGEIVLEPTFF